MSLQYIPIYEQTGKEYTYLAKMKYEMQLPRTILLWRYGHTLMGYHNPDIVFSEWLPAFMMIAEEFIANCNDKGDMYAQQWSRRHSYSSHNKEKNT